VTQDEINHLLSGWLSHRLEDDKTARADTAFAEDRARRNGNAVHDEAAALWRWDAETRLEEWQEVAERHDWATGEHLANVVIKQHNLKITKESDAYRML
jgi:hypothetical protein